MKLDLGCGMFTKKGYVGVDKDESVKPDIVLDVDMSEHYWHDRIASYLFHKHPKQPIITDVYSSHLVEHVMDLPAFMNKCANITRPEGLITIRHPYQHNDRAWQDPTHRRALNEHSWDYYSLQWRKDMLGVSDYANITCDLTVVDLLYVMTGTGVEMRKREMPERMRNAVEHSINVVDDLIVTMRVHHV